MSNTASQSSSVKRALISVTDKRGVVELGRGLRALGVEILSTGGTAKALTEGGVEVVPLERFTGFAEMLDGRVKTLHPKVHAGILARRGLPDHVEQMKTHGLDYIDMVVVNLYDFTGAASRADATFEEVVEQIDIGGPTMLRSAAKNHEDVLVVVDPDDYEGVLKALQEGAIDPAKRRAFALKVFEHTHAYDGAVSAYLRSQVEVEAAHPATWSAAFERVETLRYGENPHQTAAFYKPSGEASGIAAAEQLQGKALSYNNILDLDAAYGLAVDLPEGSAVFIKHNNPSGAAVADTPAEALRVARACDPLSAFGSVVAVDRPLDLAAAQVLTEAFVEVVLAPGFSPEALEVLAKKKNLRVLRLPQASDWAPQGPGEELRRVRGGMLVQSRDGGSGFLQEVQNAKVVTKRAPSVEERAALEFAWRTARHVRSNAIVFSHSDRLVAVGAGQMSRVDSVKICRMKAQDALKGAVVASDAFFPFRDGVDNLAEAGATAIVQPGGSIRDEEVIQAADEHGLAMIFTGIRHFRH